MSRVLCLLLVFCSPLLLACSQDGNSPTNDAEEMAGATSPASDDSEEMAVVTSLPSDDAKDMAGAMGTIPFEPTDWTGTRDHPNPPGPTTYWLDTDGVAPGVAGCHVGVTQDREPNGRFFGEACLESGLLVESNPSGDKLHAHTNDVGSPDTFDCNAWCIGEGAAGGACEAAPAPDPCTDSAICACS